MAYAELRMILARLVWNFDFEVAERSDDWMEKQRSYLHWDKTPLHVYLAPSARS